MAPFRGPVFAVTILASLATPAQAGQAGGQAKLTLAQIKATFDEARGQIHSLYYEAENEGRSLDTPAGVVRCFRTTAAIAPYRRYLEVVHLIPGLDWEDDPDWERTFLTPGHLTVFWVNRRGALTSAKAANPGQNPKLASVFHDYFLECTGWWPQQETGEGRPDWAAPTPQAVHVVLGRADLRLKGGLETVGGRPCAVVSTPDGLDTLWFDVDRGCALVQRHWTNPKERLHACYTNDSFREVAPGVWLPWELRRVVHRGRSPGEIPDDELLVLMRATRRIRSLRVNDVAEETFRFQPPPGTAVEPRDNIDESYVIPGGTDLLDVSVRISQKLLQLRPTYSNAPGLTRWVIWIGWAVLGGAAAAVVWLAVSRIRRSVCTNRMPVPSAADPAA